MFIYHLLWYISEDISLPFLSFSNESQQLQRYLDGVSDVIHVPTGFPFGLKTHTTAYVSGMFWIIFLLTILTMLHRLGLME